MTRLRLFAGLVIAASVIAAATTAVAQIAPVSPVLGAQSIDPVLHDRSPVPTVPLPIETDSDFEALVAISRPNYIGLTGPSALGRSTLSRIENGSVGRLVRKVGGDEIIIPVWTLHFGRNAAKPAVTPP